MKNLAHRMNSHLEQSHLWCQGVDGLLIASYSVPRRFLQTPWIASALAMTQERSEVLQAWWLVFK